MKRRTAKGDGALARKVGCLLEALLSADYPGILVDSTDFWFQSGDYRKATWDLARWGPCGGKCKHRAIDCAHRIDMEDRTGTPVCARCRDDMFDCGLFTFKPWNLRHHLPDPLSCASVRRMVED